MKKYLTKRVIAVQVLVMLLIGIGSVCAVFREQSSDEGSRDKCLIITEHGHYYLYGHHIKLKVLSQIVLQLIEKERDIHLEITFPKNVGVDEALEVTQTFYQLGVRNISLFFSTESVDVLVERIRTSQP